MSWPFVDPALWVPPAEPPSLADVARYRADLAARLVPAPASWPRDGEARRRHDEQLYAQAPAPEWIIITPASGKIIDADPATVPQAPRLVARAATEAGSRVRVTYSLCESSSGLLEVHVVRVRREGGAGWASWWNGSTQAAQWLEVGAELPRNVGATEFKALATGVPYEPPAPRPPPPEGPCPRCGRVVRWKLNPTPEPYAHKREITDESKVKRKEPCT